MAEKLKSVFDNLNGGLVTTLSNDNIGPNNRNSLIEFPILDNFEFTNNNWRKCMIEIRNEV